MLDQNTIDIVKSTAPVLNEHGETLTKHFYSRMFNQNPEVAPFFNPAHQTSGSQQKALAAAICAYAANIDNLEVLGKAVELIAQKHASLQIKAEHYPIVGENLLASIKEVLGESATDEILGAWAKAYGFLADILMAREAEIYNVNHQKLGGWQGFKEFVVTRKEAESEIITSFYLQPKDKEKLPDYLAGQYITVRLKAANGQTTMRNYSLSDKPGVGYFRISVKREAGTQSAADGYVSNQLHQNIKEGDIIEVAPPCGDFYIDPNENNERPLVLLAGGIGITPLLSMLMAALDSNHSRPIIFVHASLNPQVQAFKKAIDELDQQHANLSVYYLYSDTNNKTDEFGENCTFGLLNTVFLESILLNKDANYYFCGPQPFMINLYKNLAQWGIPETQIHFEFFGPQEALQEK